MTFRKKASKIITVALIGLLVSIPVLGTVSAMEKDTSNSSIEEIIESNVKYESDGLSIVSEENLNKELECIDIGEIKEELKSIGVDQSYIDNFSKETIVNSVEENIQEINDEIESEKVEVRGEKDLVDVADEGFYVQGGSTYSKKYSWGIRHYKSTASANTWVRGLSKHINGIQLTSALSFVCAPYGVPGGIAGSLTVWYFTGMRDEVSYYNAKNNRGIILDMKSWLAYSVRNQ